jgi:hypothetical protein
MNSYAQGMVVKVKGDRDNLKVLEKYKEPYVSGII